MGRSLRILLEKCRVQTAEGNKFIISGPAGNEEGGFKFRSEKKTRHGEKPRDW
jgi:hypothetical protein